jgi:hypothetical protein
MAAGSRLRSVSFETTRHTGTTNMNRTTSRHVAASLAADRWAAADRARALRDTHDETGNNQGRLTALTAWASRVQRAVSLMARRTAGQTALD